MWRRCRRYRHSQRASADYSTHGRACHRTGDCCPDDGTHTFAYSCLHRSTVDADCCTDNPSSDACAGNTHGSRCDKGCAHCSADSGGSRDACAIHTCGYGCGNACACDDNSCSTCCNAATGAAAHPDGSATTDG